MATAQILTSSKTTDERRLSGVRPDLGEERSRRAQVSGPADPACIFSVPRFVFQILLLTSMASIHVHVDSDGRQLLEGVVDTCLGRIRLDMVVICSTKIKLTKYVVWAFAHF